MKTARLELIPIKLNTTLFKTVAVGTQPQVALTPEDTLTLIQLLQLTVLYINFGLPTELGNLH